MSASVFSGLSFARRDGQIEISYPVRIHEFARVVALARAHGVAVRQSADETWVLSYSAAEGVYPHTLKSFFAELNDLPPPYPPFDPAGFVPGDPLVSCIVVVNENLPFVREQLLPSLLANTRKYPIEVVVVCNGSV